MTTITVDVPDNEVSEVKQLLELSGNVLRAEMLKQAIMALHAKSEIDGVLKRGLTEVEAIEKGELNALSFNDLWND